MTKKQQIKETVSNALPTLAIFGLSGLAVLVAYTAFKAVRDIDLSINDDLTDDY